MPRRDYESNDEEGARELAREQAEYYPLEGYDDYDTKETCTCGNDPNCSHS